MSVNIQTSSGELRVADKSKKAYIPIASSSSLGVVKVGNGLEIETDGTLNVVGGGGGSLNFSTDETVIGTWIDGKPLYQKTFQFQTPTTYPGNAILSFNLGLFDLDTFMIDISHSFLVGKNVSITNRNPNINLRSGNTTSESLILTSNLSKVINPNASNYNDIVFMTRIDNSGNYLNCAIYLTIQYTKTTD